jgi:hypothetical protein
VDRVTRGTTNPQRLRRVDRWLLHRLGATVPPDLVVDLGFGASGVTTYELFTRLQATWPGVQVVGLEISADRVAQAQRMARPGLRFALGGFDLAGLEPQVVRAFNVLRQYDESEVAAAWTRMAAPGRLVLEGTCDEVGRRAAWVVLDPGPTELVLCAHLGSLQQPSELAERLPKALIHRNVPGEGVHAWLCALDRAWLTQAGVGVFGPRQRWLATVGQVRAEGWPVLGGPRRWRLGEVSVAWQAVAPVPR